jgi:hypothetical protein
VNTRALFVHGNIEIRSSHFAVEIPENPCNFLLRAIYT